MFDAVIVGGGPAGCFTGKLLAKRGFEVAIIEEHAEIGNPVCCAGIVGVGGLRELGIKPNSKWALNKLRNALIYPPAGEPIVLTRKKVEALSIDRALFDKELAYTAADAGTTFMMKTRCINITIGEKASVKIRKVDGWDELETRLVIGADGPVSLVARKAGLLKKASYTRCVQVEVEAEIDDDCVEVYLGNSFAPGFSAWLVPAGGMCRAGLGASTGAPKLLEFLKTHPAASKKVHLKKLTHLTAGLIPQPLTRKIYGDRVMLVGDAAGHVKPLTGGGIYLGLACAKIAAEVAVQALETENSPQVLQRYERAVAEQFGVEFEFGSRARRLLERLSDAELNDLLKLLATPELLSLVLEKANFNHHGQLLKSLIRRSPSLIRSLGLKKLSRYLRYSMQ